MKRETIINTLALLGLAPRHIRDFTGHGSYIFTTTDPNWVVVWLYPQFLRSNSVYWRTEARDSVSIGWDEIPSPTLRKLYDDMVK